jgi:hypothetical protein
MQILGAQKKKRVADRQVEFVAAKVQNLFSTKGLRDTFRVLQSPAMRLTVRLYGPTCWGHTPRARSLTIRKTGYATVAAAIR